MTVQISSDEVWQVVEKEIFGVIGMVTAKNEARTVGVVYIVRDRKLYIASGKDTWKARHIRQNPNVSMTVTIPKRVPIAPWIKIPAATITFSGRARIIAPEDASAEIKQAIFRGSADDDGLVSGSCLIEMVPKGHFITYGIGVPLMQMRYPEKARGRAPVE